MRYQPRPGAAPWPFDPDDVRTDPNSGWGCNGDLTECAKCFPIGNTSYLHYDPETKYGEGPHWDGIVKRRIYASVPPKVEYSLTALGRSLCNLVEGICGWAEANIEQVQAAREVYAQTPGDESVPQ